MQDERRRYFRISDQVGVAYYPVAEGDPAADTGAGSEARLLQCDETIGRLLEELAGADPRWLELVQCLNTKLDCMVEQLRDGGGLEATPAHPVCSVNISASGLGLRLDQSLTPGSQVALDLMLLPERRRLQALSRVVACEPCEEEHYYVRFEFEDLSPSDQEELIQHIVRRQSDLLRRAREAGERE